MLLLAISIFVGREFRTRVTPIESDQSFLETLIASSWHEEEVMADDIHVAPQSSKHGSAAVSRVTTLLAIAGGLIGLASGAIHVANYFAERPRLVPAVDRIELQA